MPFTSIFCFVWAALKDESASQLTTLTTHRCDEASNLVMPKWYLMTVCSAETKPKPKKSKPPRKPVSFSNPTFENSKLVLESDNSKDMRAHNPLKSHSVVTISKIQISEPLPYTPPTTQIQISKPKRPLPPQINNLKISEPISSDPPPVNNLASSIPNLKNPFRKGEGKERTLVKDRRFDGDKVVLDTRISIPMIEMKNDDRESTLTENMASSSPSRFLKDNKSSRLLKECVWNHFLMIFNIFIKMIWHSVLNYSYFIL